MGRTSKVFFILKFVYAEIYDEANLPYEIVPHKNLTAWQF
jgi:hypothetical protein